MELVQNQEFFADNSSENDFKTWFILKCFSELLATFASRRQWPKRGSNRPLRSMLAHLPNPSPLTSSSQLSPLNLQQLKIQQILQLYADARHPSPLPLIYLPNVR